MSMLPEDVQKAVKMSLDYKEEPARICKNCKHYSTYGSGIAESSWQKEVVCGIMANVGYLSIDPNGSCKRFAKRS